nr:CHAD domain-containing protein [Kitasatospora cheerisanensis]
MARTRAHTALLQELRSARLHALADRMTLLAGEVPLVPEAAAAPAVSLLPQTAAALGALAAAAERLPWQRAAQAYGGAGLHRLGAAPAEPGTVPPPRTGPSAADTADAALAADDAPWLRARILVKRARYALEVCSAPDGELLELDRVLGRHQEASDSAATVATAARTPRITPATAYVLGVVHADQRLDVEAARYDFGRQWPVVAPGLVGPAAVASD